ncbi:hypothetical protein IMSHALPRED_009770 [Imshaugia aleurites]|uniref:Uncharacterized protein n=1 Tax=Imshaugia aleurites TaxID=172621 RepID=A0A8H3IZ87_9LECA|nr:hypothetical protein IMSHALPRED_009770 [Imshaugia aleurites]
MGPKKDPSKPTRGCSSVETQHPTRTKATTQSSTSSLTSERRTPDQHRGFGNNTFFAGTTAHTQYGVAETFGPESQRPTADQYSAYISTMEHRDLPGLSLQTPGTGTVQHRSRTARMEETLDVRTTASCSKSGP